MHIKLQNFTKNLYTFFYKLIQKKWHFSQLESVIAQRMGLFFCCCFKIWTVSDFPAVQFNLTVWRVWRFCVCVMFFLCAGAADLSLEGGLNKVFPCSHATHQTHQQPGETTRLLGPPRLTANLVPCLLPNVPFAVVLMNLAVKLISSPPPLFTVTPSNQPVGPAIVSSSLSG